jgi:hydroxymethylbilane synthase
MKKKIIIGSRGSKLALIYAERAKVELLKNQEIGSVEIKSITTTGDTLKNVRVSEYGGKGAFCKKIEQELLNNNIDVAVHALKDMPTDETDGLITNCFLERSDPREILISHSNKIIKELKPKAIVGTSSYRREFQLKNIRNDLMCKLIRGNIDTRIKKLEDNQYDAIILSYAGIKSLGLEKKISQIFSTSEIIPCAGQGVIALQCNKDNQHIIEILNKVNHQKTHNCIKAERSVLKVLEGDCETAVGVFASIEGNKINLEAELFSLDGSERFHLKLFKDVDKAIELGNEMGQILKKLSNNSYKK